MCADRVDRSVADAVPLQHSSGGDPSFWKISRGHLSSLGAGFFGSMNHICDLFADHDAGGVGVATGDCGHDGCVGNAKMANAADAKFWVHHGLGVKSHLTRTHRMPQGLSTKADVLLKIWNHLAREELHIQHFA